MNYATLSKNLQVYTYNAILYQNLLICELICYLFNNLLIYKFLSMQNILTTVYSLNNQINAEVILHVFHATVSKTNASTNVYG